MRDLLSADSVWAAFEGRTKQEILKSMAAEAGAILKVDPVSIFDVLWEREKLGSTAVGQGIAIPHGRVEGVTKVQAFFARLAEPQDFGAQDDRPVDLVFLLLAPAEAGADHLHALAAVSKLLRNQEVCAGLRKAKDETALYRLLTEAETAEAA